MYLVEIFKDGRGITKVFETHKEVMDFYHAEIEKGGADTYTFRCINSLISNAVFKVDNKNESFKPYLKRGNQFLGYVGEEANITDTNGTPLKTGDLVLVVDEKTKLKT